MATDWIVTASTAAVGLAGILATWFAGARSNRAQRELQLAQDREQRSRYLIEKRANLYLDLITELDTLFWHADLSQREARIWHESLPRMHDQYQESTGRTISQDEAREYLERHVRSRPKLVAYDTSAGLRRVLELNAQIGVWGSSEAVDIARKSVANAMSVSADLLSPGDVSSVPELRESIDMLTQVAIVDIRIHAHDPTASYAVLMREFADKQSKATGLGDTPRVSPKVPAADQENRTESTA